MTKRYSHVKDNMAEYEYATNNSSINEIIDDIKEKEKWKRKLYELSLKQRSNINRKKWNI